MLGLIDSGKYNIIEILTSNDDYEASLCIDVAVKNDYAMYIVNNYKSKNSLREFLPMYYALSKDECRDYVDLITASGSVMAMFRYHSGIKFYEYFVKGNTLTYEERLKYANSLLSAALELDMIDSYFAYCALQSDNVRVDTANQRIDFNYMVPPQTGDIPDNFRADSLGNMLRALFPHERLLPVEIEDFCEDVAEGRFRTCLEIYSGWRAIQTAAAKTYSLYQRESFLQYLVRDFRRKRYLKKRRARAAAKNN